MKCHGSNRKEKNVFRIEKMLCAKNLISIDQPFDYEEVVALTGSDYVQNLNYDGVICIPYEELRRNSADVNGSEKEYFRMIMEMFDAVHEYA
jgi:hypothetical protein